MGGVPRFDFSRMRFSLYQTNVFSNEQSSFSSNMTLSVHMPFLSNKPYDFPLNSWLPQPHYPSLRLKLRALDEDNIYDPFEPCGASQVDDTSENEPANILDAFGNRLRVAATTSDLAIVLLKYTCERRETNGSSFPSRFLFYFIFHFSFKKIELSLQNSNTKVSYSRKDETYAIGSVRSSPRRPGKVANPLPF